MGSQEITGYIVVHSGCRDAAGAASEDKGARTEGDVMLRLFSAVLFDGEIYVIGSVGPMGCIGLNQRQQIRHFAVDYPEVAIDVVAKLKMRPQLRRAKEIAEAHARDIGMLPQG